jgi:hypothetical protein
MNETPLTVPLEIQEEQAKLELRLMQLDIQGKAKNNFINFVKYVWPEAILGAHHTKMADAFDRVARGELKRLILNMPPRHTKSEFASYLLPAFVMGNKPKTKIIEATHTGELAVRFGRKVRDLMGLENYREIFPGCGAETRFKGCRPVGHEPRWGVLCCWCGRCDDWPRRGPSCY